VAMPCAKWARTSAVAWDHNQGVDRLRHCDVLDGRVDIGLMLISGREHAGDELFSPESAAKVRGRTKLLGGAGHHDLHANAAVLQEADNLGAL